MGGKQDGAKVQEAYVTGLIQQIKLLELEITYLKQHSPRGGNFGAGGGIGEGSRSSPQLQQSKVSATSSPTKDLVSSASPTKFHTSVVAKKSASGYTDASAAGQEDVLALRKELSDRSARLEEALRHNAKLQTRLKTMEVRSAAGGGDVDERFRRQLDTVATLTTKCEQLEADCLAAEARYKDTVDLLEKQTIMGRDKDQKIEQLTGDMETNYDQLNTAKNDLEAARSGLSNAEKQMAELQDRYYNIK